jgi:hypothetical protein
MSKFLLSFLALFSFSNLAFAGSGCAAGTSGAMDGLILCVVDEGKSNVELVATGLIAVSALLFGVYVVVSALRK